MYLFVDINAKSSLSSDDDRPVTKYRVVVSRQVDFTLIAEAILVDGEERRT